MSWPYGPSTLITCNGHYPVKTPLRREGVCVGAKPMPLLPPIVGGVGESHCHLLLVAWDRGALPHIRHGFSW